MRFIQVENNVKVAVYDLNPASSKVVFLVHGWPLNQSMYEYQKEMLLNAGYRVITMDLRGFGASDVPASGYNYDTFAADIYQVVKELHLNAITLVGFSMGGGIVSRYMGKYNGYGVHKLCLLSAASPRLTQAKDFSYGIAKETWDEMIVQISVDRAKLCHTFSNDLFYSKHSAEIKHWFELMALSASGIGTIQSAFSIRDEDCRNDLKKIKVPTGIFHGQKDTVVPYDLALIQNQMIPGSVVYPFADSGHGVFYDELDKFNPAFLSFLKS